MTRPTFRRFTTTWFMALLSMPAVFGQFEDEADEISPSPARSSLNVRHTLPVEADDNEFARPRYQERSTRHGFEIKTARLTVVARTSADDARTLCEIAEAAWEAGSQRLDPLTKAHRRPEFARGTVMLVLGEAPRNERSETSEIVTHHGTQTLIQLDPTSDELETEADVAGAVHAAIVETLLHKTQLDERLPDWVCDGLAGFAARQAAERSQTEEAPAGERKPPRAARVWERNRATQDELETAARETLDHEELANQIKFLLTGAGGRYAQAFYEAASESIAAAELERKLETREFPHKSHADDDSREAIEGPFQELCSQLANDYLAWRKDANVGVPVIASHTTDPIAAEAQREMLVVLQLIRRVNDRPAAGVRLKVTGISKDGKPIAETPRRTDRYLSLEDLFRKVTDDHTPLSFLDAAGELVLPSDHQRVREALGLDEQRYRPQWNGEHWTLISRLADGRTLQGRLEENADQPSRPLAKFEISPIRTVRKE